MIDKHFYNENLLAFETLIETDRTESEKVIFKVYCILQRDKLWLNQVATEEEYTEEDVEYLHDIEIELSQLDVKYGFRFADFHKLVEQEMNRNLSSPLNDENNDIGLDDEDDFYYEDEDEEEELLDHFSDEELDLIINCLLKSAKTRFNYLEFIHDFPISEEDFIDQNVILPIIVETANQESVAIIAQKISVAFLVQGFYLDTEDLITMVEQKGKEFGLEIMGFNLAMDSLRQGAEPRSIVPHIAKLLGV